MLPTSLTTSVRPLSHIDPFLLTPHIFYPLTFFFSLLVRSECDGLEPERDAGHCTRECGLPAGCRDKRQHQSLQYGQREQLRLVSPMEQDWPVSCCWRQQCRHSGSYTIRLLCYLDCISLETTLTHYESETLTYPITNPCNFYSKVGCKDPHPNFKCCRFCL